MSDDLNTRVSVLAERLAQHVTVMGELKENLVSFEKRVDTRLSSFESRFHTGNESFKTEIKAELKEKAVRLDALESKVIDFNNTLTVKLAILETKSKIFGFVAGAVSSAIISSIIYYLTKIV